MVTLEQVEGLRYGDVLHYTGPNYSTYNYRAEQPCRKIVGPRGGEKFEVIRVRVTGALKTWKTRPGEFRLPVKHGMRENDVITHDNAENWHRAVDCPVEELRY